MTLVTDCRPDPGRLAPLQPSLDDARNGDAGPDDAQAEWPHNVVSTRTVAYSCGALARTGEPVAHRHDRDEVERCRRLAAEAAAHLAGVPCFGGEPCGGYAAFFVTVNAGAAAPEALTADVVRAAFGGTLYPDTPIHVSPLDEDGPFWDRLSGVYEREEDYDDDGGPTPAEEPGELAAWRRCIRWLLSHPELRGGSYVTVGYRDGQGPNRAAVFPRLVVALTPAGSLVGACGCTAEA